MVRIGKAVCKANDMVDVLLLCLCVDMKVSVSRTSSSSSSCSGLSKIRSFVFRVFVFFEIFFSLWRLCAVSSTMCLYSFKSEAGRFTSVSWRLRRRLPCSTRTHAVILLLYFYFYSTSISKSSSLSFW